MSERLEDEKQDEKNQKHHDPVYHPHDFGIIDLNQAFDEEGRFLLASDC